MCCTVLHRTNEFQLENTQKTLFNVDQNISIKTLRFITNHFPIKVDYNGHGRCGRRARKKYKLFYDKNAQVTSVCSAHPYLKQMKNPPIENK